jgi:hypothetical protein
LSADVARRDFRKKIDELQDALIVHPGRIEGKLEHFFAHGLYGRQLFIPKGTAYVGKIHRFSHMRFVLGGHLLIITDEGRYHCRAPHFMVTPAETRRVGFAYEDTIVMTVHATSHTDIDEIEREIIMPREEQLLLEGDT